MKLDQGGTMRASDYLRSNYLGQADFPQPARVEIVKVDEADFTRPGEKTHRKPLLYFRGYDRPFPVNPTNLKRLVKAWGDDMESYVGRWVEVYVDPDVEYGGQIIGGLRLRPIATPVKRPLAAPAMPKKPAPAPVPNGAEALAETTEGNPEGWEDGRE